MKQLASNLKKGEVKIQIESLDDLWYLSNLVDPGDSVSGRTLRKIKVESTDRSAKATRKPVFMRLEVEKVEFSKTSPVLRVLGRIVEGPDDIPKGSHHTFTVEEQTILKIIKSKWLRFQLDRLKEATKAKTPKILICVLDREEAHFASMKKYGYELVSTLKGSVQKKGAEEKLSSDFYGQVIKTLEEYDRRFKLDKIILASPAFFKDDLMKDIKNEELRNKIILASCSSVGTNGIDEVLKREETRTALAEDRIAKEMELVERLLSEISKDNLAVYSLKDTRHASEAGAVEILLTTDSLIRKKREDNSYEELDSIMKLVDSMKGDVHIISSDHDAGKKLDGLGGIGAITRYKLNY